MTQDRTRKREIRARMAASGEPYSVASRRLAADDGPALTGEAAEIVACAVRTLGEASARMANRTDWTLPRLADMGLAVRVIGTAVKAYWNWNAPDTNPAHLAFEGFAEPAAGRYMADCRGLAELRAAGITFFGRSGCLLDDIPFSGRSESGDSLWHLRLLPGTTRADPQGTEMLRGTLCRKFTAYVDVARATAASRVKLQVPRGIPDGCMLQPSLELAVWIDD
jgi:hypothetical protein